MLNLGNMCTVKIEQKHKIVHSAVQHSPNLLPSSDFNLTMPRGDVETQGEVMLKFLINLFTIFAGKFELKLSPADKLTFAANETTDASVKLSITNASEGAVAWKVK